MEYKGYFNLIHYTSAEYGRAIKLTKAQLLVIPGSTNPYAALALPFTIFNALIGAESIIKNTFFFRGCLRVTVVITGA